MKNLFERILRAYFSSIITTRAPVVVALCLLLTGLSIWVLVEQWNINSDFKALLPQSSEAAQAMTEVSDRIGSGSALFVVIDSPDLDANKSFAKTLSDKLRENPKVALAHYHNDKKFFDEHQLLYLEVEDLEKLHTRIKKKIKDEKKKANPLFVDLGFKKKKKKGDGFIKTDDIAGKYKDGAQNQYKEFLVSDDRYSLTIIVRFVESSTNLVATNALLSEVRGIVDGLDPPKFQPEMTVEFGGGLVSRQKEYKRIVDDVVKSAVFTIGGLFLVIAIYFRRFRAILLVLGPLIIGILWTLAIAFLIFGELTTVTTFIFAILLGLGIDFAIHLLSSYDAKRVEGHDTIEALIQTYLGTGSATLIGALTTFVTFVVLSFAQFRGLSEFGIVAAIGVVCSITAMMTMLPATIVVWQNIKPIEPSVVEYSGNERIGRIFARFGIVMILVAGAITAFAGSNLENVEFEENFRSIGSVDLPWQREANRQKAIEADAAEWGRRHGVWRFRQARRVRQAFDPKTFKMDREQKTIGKKYSTAVGDNQTSTPTIILFDDAESTARVFKDLDLGIKDGTIKTLKSAASIHAFVPGTKEQQLERLKVIAEMRATVNKEGTSFLKGDQKKKMEELKGRLEVDKPISVYDLPIWTKRLFKEAGAQAKPPHDGETFAFEYTVYINEDVDHLVGDDARRFLSDIQAVGKRSEVDLRVASQSYIYTSMLDEIQTDGPRMMGIALVIVFLILCVAFRSPFRALFAYTPLLIGAIWTFGFCGWLGIRFDFFNVIILPVVIGIGVDDGVHFYHRYMESGRGSLGDTWRHVGSAVFMTSVTSAIGFGGLAITNHSGLQSIGYVAITGILCTLISTVLVLPALIQLAEKFGFDFVAAPKS